MTNHHSRAFAAVCLLAAFGLADNAGASQATASIEGAWVRAMPPMQKSTAAYLTLHNRGDQALRVVGASSVPGARVEMHNSAMVGGMMTMEHLETVSVPPGQSIEFSPGGMHLMMMELEKMPAPGERLTICLEFESAEPLCAQAEVRKTARSANNAMHNHKH